MQSGIKASTELKEAFTALLNTPSQFAVLVTIKSETLVPSSPISSSSPFPAALSSLSPHLSLNAAAYILFRTTDSFVAATYVPNSAPVREKMLFASSRLSLVRELGTEHFAETLFVTDAAELTPAGWEKHEAHKALDAPLTKEEQGARDLDSETTGVRRVETSGGRAAMGAGEGVVEALKELGEGKLVSVGLDLTTETFVLVKTAEIARSQLQSEIPSTEPRYTFYGYPGAGNVFIYTCPPDSKIKERMVYASARITMVKVAEDQAGLTLVKRMEGAGPEDFSEDVMKAEFGKAEDKVETKGFARPKRPGRR